MTSTVSLTRFVAITLTLIGFLFLATHISVAAPQLPTFIQPATPIYVGNENQVRTGSLGVLITNFLSGTKFEVLGGSKFENGLNILNSPIIINGPTAIGNPGYTKKLNIMGGNLVVTDGGPQQPNGISPSNIQVAGLIGPTTSPICALQSGQLVRC